MKAKPNLTKLIAFTGALILSTLPMGKAEEKKKTDAPKSN